MLLSFVESVRHSVAITFRFIAHLTLLQKYNSFVFLFTRCSQGTAPDEAYMISAFGGAGKIVISCNLLHYPC